MRMKYKLSHQAFFCFSGEDVFYGPEGREVKNITGTVALYGLPSGPCVFYTWVQGGERHWEALPTEKE